MLSVNMDSIVVCKDFFSYFSIMSKNGVDGMCFIVIVAFFIFTVFIGVFIFGFYFNFFLVFNSHLTCYNDRFFSTTHYHLTFLIVNKCIGIMQPSISNNNCICISINNFHVGFNSNALYSYWNVSNN